METYSIIEISTGNKIQSNLSYQQCIDWLDTYGNIIDYTIIQDN
jgi:hypothetical protein